MFMAQKSQCNNSFMLSHNLFEVLEFLSWMIRLWSDPLSFRSLAGMKYQIEQLQYELVLPIIKPELFKARARSATRGFLL